MPTFALIAEGLTDHVVLERLIEEVCAEKFDEDIFVNPIQPVRDTTDSHTAPHAGWSLVIEACENKSVMALDANDFLVVQIDTDCGELFGLSLTENGADRSLAELLHDAKEILRAKIGDAIYIGNEHRICFAICVHSIESWLLLLIFGDNALKGGERRLGKKLERSNESALAKTERRYSALCRGLRKKGIVAVDRGDNSLGDFVTQLEAL